MRVMSLQLLLEYLPSILWYRLSSKIYKYEWANCEDIIYYRNMTESGKLALQSYIFLVNRVDEYIG